MEATSPEASRMPLVWVAVGIGILLLFGLMGFLRKR
jgi:hypothetical protein